MLGKFQSNKGQHSLLCGKHTGDHHKDALEVQRKVFTASQHLHEQSPKSHSPEPYSSLLFIRKTHITVVTLQLARSRSIETKRHSQGLSKNYGLGLFFFFCCFGRRWAYLLGLNIIKRQDDVSNMVSVLLRSEGLLQLSS